MADDRSVIAKCDCKQEFQDQQYGRGLRVHNPAFAKGAMPQRYRCTGCKKERSIDNRKPQGV
jgi:hypothetical protein